MQFLNHPYGIMKQSKWTSYPKITCVFLIFCSFRNNFDYITVTPTCFQFYLCHPIKYTKKVFWKQSLKNKSHFPHFLMQIANCSVMYVFCIWNLKLVKFSKTLNHSTMHSSVPNRLDLVKPGGDSFNELCAFQRRRCLILKALYLLQAILALAVL